MGILLISAFILPALLYLFAWRLGIKGPVMAPDAGPPDASVRPIGDLPPSLPARYTGMLVMVLALLAHAASLYLAVGGSFGAVADAPSGGVDSVHIGFAHILSAALWIGVAVLWLEGDGVRAGAMRSLVLPVAALAAPLPLLFPGAAVGDYVSRPFFLPHMVVGIGAYAVLLLAVVHAMLMAMAERSLHGTQRASFARLRPLVDKLPALLTMERILFRLLGIGFVLLTLTAVSGLFFSEEIFGQSLRFDHKTVLTLIAWVVFGVLLAGRYLWGWRGRTALRLTVAGYVVMLLGYAGSRFVLEVILARY